MDSVDKKELEKFPVFQVKTLYEQELDKKNNIEYIDPYKDYARRRIYNFKGEYVGIFQGVGSVLTTDKTPTILNLEDGIHTLIENAHIEILKGGKKRRTKRHRKNRRTTKRRKNQRNTKRRKHH